MFVEQVLTERIGDTGKRLHTARSRNDQVAHDPLCAKHLRMCHRAGDVLFKHPRIKPDGGIKVVYPVVHLFGKPSCR